MSAIPPDIQKAAAYVPQVGDTVRVLRCRNAYGEDISAIVKKPVAVGETFVVGEVQNPVQWDCPIVFPELEFCDFWRADDLELVSPAAIRNPS